MAQPDTAELAQPRRQGRDGAALGRRPVDRGGGRLRPVVGHALVGARGRGRGQATAAWGGETLELGDHELTEAQVLAWFGGDRAAVEQEQRDVAQLRRRAAVQAGAQELLDLLHQMLEAVDRSDDQEAAYYAAGLAAVASNIAWRRVEVATLDLHGSIDWLDVARHIVAGHHPSTWRPDDGAGDDE